MSSAKIECTKIIELSQIIQETIFPTKIILFFLSATRTREHRFERRCPSKRSQREGNYLNIHFSTETMLPRFCSIVLD